MNRYANLALVFVAAALFGSIATTLAAPHWIMTLAMARMAHDDHAPGGSAINRFRYALRVDPHARWVVRPSPDMAFASCVYDLGHGPILVTARPSADHGYASVSVFAANTDNIAVFDTHSEPGGIRFVLAMPWQAVPLGDAVVRATTRRGVILDRRLVPDGAAFAAADQARRSDTCAPL